MQLILGLICMMAISSPQYVWTLFTKPLTAQLGVSLTQLQVTFSVFIVLQTFLSPLQGYLIEKSGPKLLLAAGAIMTGLSWVLASSADTLMSVYLTYGVLGGIGTGIIYVGIVGLMVAWFPDRRGMAAGVVAAGYGMGAVLSLLIDARYNLVIRAIFRHRVFRVGRDFLAFPFNADRHLWRKACHHELRISLYGARHRFHLRRSSCSPAARGFGQLDPRFCRRDFF
jgi:MFS family permease